MTDRLDLPLSGPSFGADPSFVELLRRSRPEALPPGAQLSGSLDVPQGTTVLGLRFADGIVMAGDRRATAGYTIADAKMRKVFAADDFSAIAIAGAAGQAVETVRLFQLELEHYEKLKEEMDEILDEIDEVLEENAEECIKSYVQKGGE